jgi:hypothetical protein
MKGRQMEKISMKAAWKQGVLAARNGEPSDANPHKPETALFQSWEDGWRLDNAPRQLEKSRI